MGKVRRMTAKEHTLVTTAVGTAEAATDGEIVTIVADRSDGYTDVALVWATIAAFAAVALYSVFPQFYLAKIDWLFGLWAHEWTEREILGIAVAILVSKFIGVMLFQLIQPVKFFLIPGRVKSARVRERAVGFFKVGAERRTVSLTGILIYLSMREHRAEIVADEAIADKVSPEVWGDAMVALIDEVREGRPGAGMAAAVEQVGKVLAEHFPKSEGNPNELPDRLIEL